MKYFVKPNSGSGGDDVYSSEGDIMNDLGPLDRKSASVYFDRF